MTSPGYCCYGCWRKGNDMPKSGRRHYYVCENHKIGTGFELHVNATESIYKALDRRRAQGVQMMVSELTLTIHKDDTKRATLTFLIHGMEPELPTDISQLGDVRPDPRYPDWEAQIEHHKEINKVSRRARETYWGCGDKSVVMYFLDMSDAIGSHLERTGRKS